MTEPEKIKQQILAQLQVFKSSRASEYDLLSLGIFGSVARGEAGESSDVDIVFETDKPNLFTASLLKQELESTLSRPVDLIRLRNRMNSRLKERIIQEAIFV